MLGRIHLGHLHVHDQSNLHPLTRSSYGHDYSFLARLLRAVLRKAGLGKSGAQPDAFVHVSADHEGLRLRAAGSEVAVEYRQPGEFPTAAIVLPVEVLATIEGRTQEPVTLMPADGQVSLSFTERGVPQRLERSIDSGSRHQSGPNCPPSIEPTRPNCGRPCVTRWRLPIENRPATR